MFPGAAFAKSSVASSTFSGSSSCLLFIGFPGLVGDHLKFAILPEDLPEHEVVNYVYETFTAEFKDDLHAISSRESNQEIRKCYV